jgi:hypothetical protein
MVADQQVLVRLALGRREPRHLASGVAAALVVALMAACSSSSPPPVSATSSATHSTSPGPSTPSAGPSPSPATSSRPSDTSSSGSAPVGASPCPTRSLSAKIGATQGAAGSTYTVIVFTNISNVPCTLYGYPGVSSAGGAPVRQIGLAATRSTAARRTLVTLAPAGAGNALLRIVQAGNYPPATCAPVGATYLQIYPPNQTTPIYLRYPNLACSKPVQILTVGVVQPGATSS